MKLTSIAVLAILNMAQPSQASTKNLSALRRPPNSDGDVAELLTEGGCHPGCDAGYFCVVPDGDCLLHGAVGECYEIRTARTRSLRTVCGCDGKTYTDRSFAAGEGVNVDHLGACDETEIA